MLVRTFSFFICFFALSSVLLTDTIAQSVPDVAINEVMASNSTTIADEDGDYPDWIELYNTTDRSINLDGYGLSDNYNNAFKWVLPEITIEPGSFLLIWASGKDRREPGSPLHTNYAISAAGEEVLLSRPDGTRLDSLPPTAIPTDVSLGRQPDGSGDWYFFNDPTPGSSNTTSGNQGVLSPPKFSHESGFYSSSFDLTITHEDPQVEIIYTVDGSEPSKDAFNGIPFRYRDAYAQNPGDSPGNMVTETTRSQTFQNSLRIRNRSSEPNFISRIPTTWNSNPFYLPRSSILKGTVVRARAVKPGTLPSEVVTRTFFVFPGGRSLLQLPVVSVAIDPKDLFDYDEGIYVPGVNFEKWRNANPNESAALRSPANYHRRGIEAEKEGRFSFFESGNDRIGLEQNIGVRIHGFTARSNPMKSLRLYARGRFGNSNFEFPFFTGGEGERHRRLLLRNSGQDYNKTLLRDPISQSLVKHMRFDTQEYRPTVVFINGEYWGIHNLRERLDRHYLEIEYGIDPDNIDLMETYRVIVEGEGDHYFNMLQYIEQNDLSDDEHYQEIITRMDPDNFMDYQIAQLFTQNMDWPGSNIQYWRVRTNGYQLGVPYGHDGRWRWLMYDLDRTMTLFPSVDPDWTFNTLFFATAEDGPSFPNPPWSTFLLRNLLKNETFRQSFINRYADQLNTAFSAERFVSLIEELSDEIRPEMDRHNNRWESLIGSISVWDSELDRMIDFASNRAQKTFEHIQEFFELNNMHQLSVTLGNPDMGHVRVNTIELTTDTPGVRFNSSTWSGTYFEEVPVRISAVPQVGHQFSHWLVDGERIENINLTLNLDADVQLQPFFEETTITPIADLDLIHYFIFSDNLPNNTPLISISSTFSDRRNARIDFESSLEGYPYNSGHPNWRLGSMERRNQPTPINYRPENNNNIPFDQFEGMRGLQIRQPFALEDRENTIIFKMPTVGFDSVVMSFVAMNENADVDGLFIDYSVQFQTTIQSDTTFVWTDEGLSDNDKYKNLVDGNYQLYTVDFSDISSAANNPEFRIRIRFDARNPSATDGNRVTFNNISLDGNPLSDDQNIVADFLLGKNYPNPFNNNTTIPFTMNETGHVRLEVFNTLGQRVALLLDENVQFGDYQVLFDGSTLASGIYLYRMNVDGFIQSRMMVFIK